MNSDVKLFSFDTDSAEREFVIQVVSTLLDTPESVFILARTNRQVNELSDVLKRKKIAHQVKTDESNGFNGNSNGNGKKEDSEEAKSKLVLATVHAIKGLEADTVFLIGANKDSFPCRASDHPVVELIKDEKYDKFEEEKRIFYVGLSRAKKNLYITHSGAQTDCITKEMEKYF